MSDNIEQARVIRNLNAYLKWHNLPLKLNTAGVCNGLAAVYSKYYLEGKASDFFRMLQYVAGKKANSEQEMEVNHFVSEVILCAFPEQFSPILSQKNAVEILKINGKALQPAYLLTLTTSDENWANILRQIALKDHETMQISSVNHAISVSRKDNQYTLYDPNYSSGFKVFETEEQLVNELHNNVFFYKKGPLGMQVQVIAHPEQETARDFPDIDELYNLYLTHEMINSVSEVDGAQFKLLSQVAGSGTLNQIERLIEKGASDIHEAAMAAVYHNNCDTLKALLPHIHETKDIQSLFKLAFTCGRNEAFHQLLTNKNCKALYGQITNAQNIGMFLNFAAQGANPDLLITLLNDARSSMDLSLHNEAEQFKRGLQAEQPNLTPEEVDARLELAFQSCRNKKLSDHILQKRNGMDAIHQAIKNGSPSCVGLLIKQVNQNLPGLDDRQYLDYFLHAIKSNQPYVVDSLLEAVPKNAFQTISMSTTMVKKTELSILQTLKKRGVQFSVAANAVIAQKEHDSVGLLLRIGIKLTQFIDFLNRVLFKNQGVDHKFSAFKTQNRDLENLSAKDEKNNEPVSIFNP